MKLIPAIDLRQGKVVRLSQGDDRRRTEYSRDPEDLLRELADAGVRWVHIVDLDAAFGEDPQRPLVERLAALAGSFDEPLKVELGGGLRNADAVAWAVDAGCERLVLGSMVVKNFDGFQDLLERFPDRLVPAVEISQGQLKISGWTESAAMSLADLCRRLKGLRCPAALVTDVDRDGTLVGPNLDLAQRVAGLSGLPAIVSGGVTNLDDLRRASALDGLDGVIVGKALYEARFTVEEAVAALAGEGGGP